MHRIIILLAIFCLIALPGCKSSGQNEESLSDELYRVFFEAKHRKPKEAVISDSERFWLEGTSGAWNGRHVPIND